jgi:hypothetical protein
MPGVGALLAVTFIVMLDGATSLVQKSGCCPAVLVRVFCVCDGKETRNHNPTLSHLHRTSKNKAENHGVHAIGLRPSAYAASKEVLRQAMTNKDIPYHS